ncbi:MAG: DEAD/DEAH box helicase [Bacteroidetes bacterium]|nr:DEAD/DEAH box helicase [Bacteroidota bacterium]MBV6460160.1 ATP-dependent RNA helicase DeaD [Flavobacteriales bacterium]WKZ74032.1 MAG: DEAD/DEAH box helicase [Vicingaceae bacterium]MCL4817394.1 DEAD/DEAH box helicase [Flavobacteriales bacterium]NOG96068.1 DEAD/DEAH box helicase [Bacteroidota bacterium]
MTFNELGLDHELLKAIETLGFVQPSPIQEKAIPVLLSGERDFVGLAQTGTGKTAAFGLPLLQQLDIFNPTVQGIILCPTRELCMQITKDLQVFAKYKGAVHIVPVYGGVSISNQIRDLKRGAHIVVATPGRLLDHIERGTIKLNTVRFAILDEADEMLNMGFQDDINDILSQTTKDKHVWLFSATMPKEVEQIARKYMNNPERITIGKVNATAENLEHQFCVVSAKDMNKVLARFIDYYPEMYGILFCRTKRDTQELANKLMKDGYNVDALHGDLSQQQRDTVMNRFRTRNIQMLIATDVAARGIDVNDVTHVLHLNLPDDSENYTHRSGRTARAGKSGISLVIINSRETGKLRSLEGRIGKKFKKVMVPTGKEICEKQLFSLIDSINNAEVDEAAVATYMHKVFTEFEKFSKEELIKRLISVEFNRYLKLYGKAPDLNLSDSGKNGDRRDKREGTQDRSEVSNELFINVGAMDVNDKSGFLAFLCDVSGVSGRDIGRINLKDSYSFFGVEDVEAANKIIKSLNGEEIEGRKIRVEFSGGAGSGNSGNSNNKGGGGFKSKGRGFDKSKQRSGGRDFNRSSGTKKNYSRGR